MDTISNKDKLRSYANILSNSTINELIRYGNTDYLNSKIKKYDKLIFNGSTYKDFFLHVFQTLKSNYRNEYIYKSLITKLLLERHNLYTTNIINEFRINKSIADVVFLNGTSVVYEIKTELDNKQRLLSQINDYKKVFKEINLVTHYSLKNKYLDLISEDIGLIVLTENFLLETIRKPKVNISFDNITILKCLRKPEFTHILQIFYGEIPKSTDFNFFNVCKELFNNIPSSQLHDLMIAELKKRSIKEKEILESQKIPEELKYICLCLDFDKHEYKTLINILKKRIKT